MFLAENTAATLTFSYRSRSRIGVAQAAMLRIQGVDSIMPKVRRSRPPKLEPELIDRGQGAPSVGGAAPPPSDRGRVSGAWVSQSADLRSPASHTIALCDGSQFTFARLADLATVADA